MIKTSTFFAAIISMCYTQIVKECVSANGSDHCLEFAVEISATPEDIFPYISDINNTDRFYPQFEFDLDTTEQFGIGSIYGSRLKGQQKWGVYKIIAFKENERMHGRLVEPNFILKHLSYDHILLQSENGTISSEKVEYALRCGILGKFLYFILVKRIVKKQLQDAHLKLKEVCEE